jgi:hypothetical protein
LPIPNAAAADDDDNDDFEMSRMSFEADKYCMTACEIQQVKDLWNLHHEFQFSKVHGACLQHNDDEGVDNDDDSTEDVTDTSKCSGFLEGKCIGLLICA